MLATKCIYFNHRQPNRHFTQSYRCLPHERVFIRGRRGDRLASGPSEFACNGQPKSGYCCRYGGYARKSNLTRFKSHAENQAIPRPHMPYLRMHWASKYRIGSRLYFLSHVVITGMTFLRGVGVVVLVMMINKPTSTLCFRFVGGIPNH